jgi:hypothetical protein
MARFYVLTTCDFHVLTKAGLQARRVLTEEKKCNSLAVIRRKEGDG